MFSIGDLIDKLIIENIKIFNLRDKLNEIKNDDQTYVETYEKMMIIVENRATICNSLDEKIARVISGKEKNEYLKKIRTYNDP